RTVWAPPVPRRRRAAGAGIPPRSPAVRRKEEPMTTERGRPRPPGATRERGAAPERRPYTFVLDAGLVERARREVGEADVVRSIEAALAAAIDYQLWVREVAAGERDALSRSEERRVGKEGRSRGAADH